MIQSMGVRGTRSAEPRRTDYEGEEGVEVGRLYIWGGEARREGGEGALDECVSIAVVSYQPDLRSRVSGKDPLAY